MAGKKVKSKKKVLALGDYVKKVKEEDLEIELDDCIVEAKLRKPNNRDSMKLMEFIATRAGDFPKDELTKEDLSELPPDKVQAVVEFWYMYDAMLISSAVYGSENGEKIWETAEDVITKCPPELFPILREKVSDLKVVMSKEDAGK
jgi:hypothetical protein